MNLKGPKQRNSGVNLAGNYCANLAYLFLRLGAEARGAPARTEGARAIRKADESSGHFIGRLEPNR